MPGGGGAPALHTAAVRLAGALSTGGAVGAPAQCGERNRAGAAVGSPDAVLPISPSPWAVSSFSHCHTSVLHKGIHVSLYSMCFSFESSSATVCFHTRCCDTST